MKTFDEILENAIQKSASNGDDLGANFVDAFKDSLNQSAGEIKFKEDMAAEEALDLIMSFYAHGKEIFECTTDFPGGDKVLEGVKRALDSKLIELFGSFAHSDAISKVDSWVTEFMQAPKEFKKDLEPGVTAIFKDKYITPMVTLFNKMLIKDNEIMTREFALNLINEKFTVPAHELALLISSHDVLSKLPVEQGDMNMGFSLCLIASGEEGKLRDKAHRLPSNQTKAAIVFASDDSKDCSRTELT